MIGADKIPALSGASYTNQPEEDDDPDRPSLFKFGQRYQVTGRSLLLFVLRRRVRTAAGRAKAWASKDGVGLVGAPSSVRTVRFGNFLDHTGFRK